MQDKITCAQCGSPNEINSRFCAVCGAKLQESKTPVGAQSATQEQSQEQASVQQVKKLWKIILGIPGMIISICSMLLFVVSCIPPMSWYIYY